MNENTAIKLKNISKTFTTRADSSKKTILRRTEKISRNVIEDINFEIKKGEVVGIIGRNGSGKSTLLKIISKIMNSDTGTVEINGKVASILELGMGFHQDLSGRDNVFLKGSMYGFTKEQIEKRFDNIVKYAELEDYIDLPVRVYSSGMSSRLAFAIMINVDADIIILDEILSTGDLAFSKKSEAHFSKMKKEGKTIIIVSHTISTIREMCDRVIWIDDGKIREDGVPNIVCGHYETELAESFDVIKELAESGVPASQNTLGRMYFDGYKTDKNLELAQFWFEEASKRGDTNAKINLADMILSKDRKKAIDLYADAATENNKEARTKLSRLLTMDETDIVEEIKKDYKELLHENVNLYFEYADFLLKTALTDNDYVNSFNWFIKSAENGNTHGMFQTAMMYLNGIGTKQNPEKYIYWLKKAAECGHVHSQFILGNLYHDGVRVESDVKKAFDWYLKAAENNHQDAIYQVAMMYRTGTGTEKNYVESDRFLKLYYRHGITKHINIVADSYAHSKNGVNNIEKGIKWYSLNVEQGDADSMYQKAMLILDSGNNVEIDSLLVSAMQKEHFQAAVSAIDLIAPGTVDEKIGEKAIHCLESLSNKGNPWASNYLGNFYLDGKIVKKDWKKAIKYLMKAANQNFHVSFNKLGEIYRDGLSVGQDLEKSAYWFLKGTDVGNPWSAVSLMNMYRAGAVDAKVYEKAIMGLKNMCTSGNISAMRILGTMYRDSGDKSDYQKAIYWLSVASEAGDPISEHYLGEMYLENKHIEKNEEKALMHFFSAADCGNINSIMSIIRMRDGIIREGAIKKLEKLALGGNMIASRNLGYLYFQGEYISKNRTEAKKWFTIASNLGDTYSKNKLAFLQKQSE